MGLVMTNFGGKDGCGPGSRRRQWYYIPGRQDPTADRGISRGLSAPDVIRKAVAKMSVLRIKTPGVTMSINSREAVEALYSALTVAYSFEKNRGLPAEGTLHDLWWQMRKVRQEQASSSPQT